MSTRNKLQSYVSRDVRDVRATMSLLNDPLVNALFSSHPNSLPNFNCSCNWMDIVSAYHNSSHQSVDQHLLHLVHAIRLLQLDRTPIHISSFYFSFFFVLIITRPLDNPLNLPSTQGMSPKKAHEVSRMASYIFHLLQVNNVHASHIRIVDIGAGQACGSPPFFISLFKNDNRGI